MDDDLAGTLADAQAEWADLEARVAARRRVVDEIETLTRLNDELGLRAAQLGRSNAALEDFAYAASHDLQAPLRAVANFAAWTAEELPPDCELVHQHIQRLLDRVERLHNLHRDLLMYARAGREQGPVQTVTLPDLVAEVWAHLAAAERATLDAAGLASEPVRLAADPLAAVLQAVFENALHHHDGADQRVVVRGGLQAGAVIVEVEDDGPGIEPRFAEQIFRVLETLRPRDAGAGSGMGLAIARKRAESAGGRIELVPRDGRGALFRIEWPLAPAEAAL